MKIAKSEGMKKYTVLLGVILLVCVILFSAYFVIFHTDLFVTRPLPTTAPVSTFRPKVSVPTSIPILPTSTPVITPTSTPEGAISFTFASMGDAQGEAALFTNTVNQIETLHPAFTIFNGDLESDGFGTIEMDPMITALKNANLFDNSFLVRGNHDAHVSGSERLWENYFETSSNIRVLPAGVSNYVSMNSRSDTLTYSFEFGNSIFIGLDVPGDVYVINDPELTFLDSRLTYAENIGLVHAFIYFHGPMYCVERVHCGCTTRTDSSCTPASLVSVVNKHPIVSAFLHGHEHIMGWTHMDNSRVAGLTDSFEEFFTSPSGGGTYNNRLYPDRTDYTYLDMASSRGFGAVTVSGDSFTFSLYKVGIIEPVWSRTFTKSN
jgi:hypothetical protein